MRWVNETRWPESFSCLRRPSIVVTASVRNEVAVGIDRLSSMYLASMPAPPRSGWGSAPGAGAVTASAGAPARRLGRAPARGRCPRRGRPRRAAVGDRGEDVGLRDAPAGPRARDVREVDALGGGDARSDGGALGVGGDRLRRELRGAVAVAVA